MGPVLIPLGIFKDEWRISQDEESRAKKINNTKKLITARLL